MALIPESGESSMYGSLVFVDDVAANVLMSAAADGTDKRLKKDGAWCRITAENKIKPGSQIVDVDRMVEMATDTAAAATLLMRTQRWLLL